ncbi:ComEC/Rec2 family competence protein [Weissella cibaria]
MLVDVGGKMNLPQPPWATPQKRDFQAQQLVQFLRGKGITRVQQLVLTHKDIDHIGNLPHFLQQIPVDNIYVPLGMMQTEAYRELVAPHCKGASVQEVQAGMRLNRWTLVKHPFKSGAGDNEDSVAVLVETGPKRLMLTGDLDQAGERNLLDDPMLARVAILKFGHHGSKTSTASEFVQRLQPNVGVVSAGVKNRFGHPNQETLVTAHQNNMQVFSTAESGMLQYCWSGKRDRWQAEITSPIQLPGRP